MDTTPRTPMPTRGEFLRLVAPATAAGLALPAFAGHALAAPAGLQGPEASPAVLHADAVYFTETGHRVAGAFWQRWRQYGLDAFGYPISEPFEDGGVRNQYFQRARFELGADGNVRLGMLG